MTSITLHHEPISATFGSCFSCGKTISDPPDQGPELLFPFDTEPTRGNIPIKLAGKHPNEIVGVKKGMIPKPSLKPPPNFVLMGFDELGDRVAIPAESRRQPIAAFLRA